MNNEEAYFSMGCFWEPDLIFSKIKGVKDTKVGYTGGKTKNPTYENLADHTETIKIIFNPNKISYNKLLEYFFKNHDATKENIAQYKSAIFYTTKDQKKKVLEKLHQLENKNIKTQLIKFDKFYLAEDYHQDYLKKNNIKTC